MARRLLLVRHARIGSSHTGRFVGATDVPLDGFGESQARALAGRVARLAPRRCYSSPMKRCRQTALATVPGMPIHFDDDLREIDFGRCEDRSFEEVAAEDPALVDRWAAFEPDFAFPGGERLGDFLDRVRATADRMAREDAETVLAVTHGGVIRAMICYLLGLEPRQYVLFDVGYAAMAVIDLRDGKGVLSALEGPDVREDPGNG
jgi:broad specificity phosphatase PhoE